MTRVRTTFTAKEVAEIRANRGQVEEVQIGNRHLKKGDIVTITKVPGDFKFFYAHIRNGEVDSICVFGGAHGNYGGKWRHFTPDRIKAKKRLSTLEAKGLL
jgi:hypothetical protein